MLFALGQPAAFAGLLIAFLLGVVLRAVAIRLTARLMGLAPRREAVRPRPREDLDPFGAVAAAIGGTGWGRPLEVDAVPRYRGRARAAAVFASGPLAAIVVAQAVFAVYTFVYAHGFAYVPLSVMLLGGVPAADYGAQVLLSVGAGLLAFGLLALLPLPPLDGFGLIWSMLRKPGTVAQWIKLWFDDNNLGVALVLLLLILPLIFPSVPPVVLALLDIPAVLLLWFWL